MPVQLMRLRGVHEDEAQDLRELLEANGIVYYETPAGNWGISMPAIWLRDEAELPRARALLDDYQRERATRVRSEYQQLKKTGQQKTFLQQLKTHPGRVVAYLVVIAIILYFSTKPFVDLAG